MTWLKAYLPLMIRAAALICGVLALYLFGERNPVLSSSILIIITSIVLLKVRGKGSSISYIISVAVILGLTFFFMSMYGVYRNITYIGYYSLFILFFGTVTDRELLYTLRYGRKYPVLIILALKIYGIIVERYYRSLEMNKALLGRRKTVFIKGIIGTLQSLPYLTFRIAEYLHVHLPYIMDREAIQKK